MLHYNVYSLCLYPSLSLSLFLSLSLSLTQVFDIVLNNYHKVVSNLDIFARVGKAIAHDEVTRFTIENGQLLVGDRVSDFDGTLRVEFAKVSYSV